MADAIRIGMVGAGFAARFHVNMLRHVAGVAVNVIGVTSLTAQSRQQFAQEFGIAAFDSVDAMLPQVDVVDICAPGYTHELLARQALEANKHVIVEKPFTGAYGPEGDESFRGNVAPKEPLLRAALASAQRMLEAEKQSQGRIMYAENWVYAPSIQKEAEILRATRGQILWMMGEESHSGSHSPAYGMWSLAGGGSLVGKACHPLTAALYLKRVEGETNRGRPLRPHAVSARTHEVTRQSAFRDAGYLRTDYRDVEDYAQIHVVFEDGFVADVFSTEIVMGGVHNWLEVCANNHRMRCNLNPVDANQLYNPAEAQLQDVYIVEKIGTKQGWSCPSPDEDWMSGYYQEMQDFMACVAHGSTPLCGSALGADTVSVLYAAYVSAERGGAEVEVPLLDV